MFNMNKRDTYIFFVLTIILLSNVDSRDEEDIDIQNDWRVQQITRFVHVVRTLWFSEKMLREKSTKGPIPEISLHADYEFFRFFEKSVLRFAVVIARETDTLIDLQNEEYDDVTVKKLTCVKLMSGTPNFKKAVQFYYDLNGAYFDGNFKEAFRVMKKIAGMKPIKTDGTAREQLIDAKNFIANFKKETIEMEDFGVENFAALLFNKVYSFKECIDIFGNDTISAFLRRKLNQWKRIGASIETYHIYVAEINRFIRYFENEKIVEQLKINVEELNEQAKKAQIATISVILESKDMSMEYPEEMLPRTELVEYAEDIGSKTKDLRSSGMSILTDVIDELHKSAVSTGTLIEHQYKRQIDELSEMITELRVNVSNTVLKINMFLERHKHELIAWSEELSQFVGDFEIGDKAVFDEMTKFYVFPKFVEMGKLLNKELTYLESANSFEVETMYKKYKRINFATVINEFIAFANTSESVFTKYDELPGVWKIGLKDKKTGQPYFHYWNITEEDQNVSWNKRLLELYAEFANDLKNNVTTKHFELKKQLKELMDVKDFISIEFLRKIRTWSVLQYGTVKGYLPNEYHNETTMIAPELNVWMKNVPDLEEKLEKGLQAFIQVINETSSNMSEVSEEEELKYSIQYLEDAIKVSKSESRAEDLKKLKKVFEELSVVFEAMTDRHFKKSVGVTSERFDTVLRKQSLIKRVLPIEYSYVSYGTIGTCGVAIEKCVKFYSNSQKLHSYKQANKLSENDPIHYNM